MMKRHKRILALTTAALLSAFPPAAAFADSPEFAYDEATWARLRDNVMEYDELPMLVEEYNPTYLNKIHIWRRECLPRCRPWLPPTRASCQPRP